MKNKYDVVIVGAGPAGLSCASVLGESGKSILVLEKNKEVGPKICGGGLTRKIKNFGISLDIADFVFSSIKIHVDNKFKIISSPTPFMATIERSKLGKVLLEEAIKNNIEVKTNVEVREISDGFVKIGEGEVVRYEHLVGADGTNSIVRKFLGLKINKFFLTLQYLVPERFEELEIFLDASFFGSGYAWVFPHKNYTSIGCCQDVRSVKGPEPRETFEKWLEARGINIGKAQLMSWPINFDYRGFQFGNVFLVGDAGGFASPLTGEGIYFAIVSGQEVARKIIDPNYNCYKMLKLLRIKRSHERTLNFMRLLDKLNRSFLNFNFKLLLFLLNFQWFVRRSIKKWAD